MAATCARAASPLGSRMPLPLPWISSIRLAQELSLIHIWDQQDHLAQEGQKDRGFGVAQGDVYKRQIFKYAFFPNAILGGGLGYALKTAISQGVKRGLFSNEAGMGSTPHAHAMAKVKTPHEQGVVAMIGVFIDTFLVLTMTALVVISTLYAGNGPLAGGAAEGIDPVSYTHLPQSHWGRRSAPHPPSERV